MHHCHAGLAKASVSQSYESAVGPIEKAALAERLSDSVLLVAHCIPEEAGSVGFAVLAVETEVGGHQNLGYESALLGCSEPFAAAAVADSTVVPSYFLVPADGP